MGTVEDIEEHAAQRGTLGRAQSTSTPSSAAAAAQEYVELGPAAARPRARRPDARGPATTHFEVQVVDSPAEMEARARRRKLAEGYSARMAAGYCWPWSDPRPDGSLVPDVQIGDWARPWNLKGDRSVGGAPPAALWASDPAGFGQVGCVYTAQGFEYDWPASSSGRTWSGATTAGSPSASANRDPDFRNRTRGQRRRRSTGWSATSTRCC